MWRIAHRALARHLGIVLALVGAVAVTLTALAVGDLRQQAAKRRAAQVAFFRLAVDTHRLNGLVLESLALGHADDDAFERVEATGRSIDQRLDRDVAADDGSRAGVVRVLDELSRYRGVAERVLASLAHGDRHAGGADKALGPAFAEVERRLEAVQQERERQAVDAEERAAFLSTLTLAGLVLTLLSLVFIHQRGRRRAQVAASRAAALAASEARFRGLVDDSSDLVLLIGADDVVRSATRAARDVFGFDPAEIEGRPITDLLHPDEIGLLASAQGRGKHSRLELRMRHRNGYWLTVEAIANDMSSDVHVQSLVLTIRDVTERKAFEEQLRHRAFHDPLTQLPNRALLSDRLQHALSRESRFEDQVAVLFVDLDDFKMINDTLGHAGGDELLVLVARRLRACLRSADTPARVGGDEFAALLEGLPDGDQAVAVAQRILDAMAEPFSVRGLPVPLRASVGVALGAAGSVSADELMRNADIAMYAAKRTGKARHVVFRADLHAELARRFPSQAGDPERVTWVERSEEQRNEVIRLLRAEDAIVPVFQPIVDLRSSAVAGYEALARFPTDPDSRPPNVWFAQAHRCGLGVQLEARAIEQALASRDGSLEGYLAINVSPAALRADELQRALSGDLTNLVIEITEHELVADGVRLQSTLTGLRERGARIAVDDAGAGYAGLRQLMLLRPDLIKLDRGLIEDVAQDEAKRALVECFVRFAQRTDAAVCAEGIESLEDLLVLADLGVAYGQGYAIARPGPRWPQPTPEALAAMRTVAVA